MLRVPVDRACRIGPRSRARRVALGLALVVVASPAIAAAQSAEAREAEPIARARYVGAMMDVGFPEGAGASLVVRPAPWVRLHGGATFNIVSPGIRGGVTFDPMPTVVGVTGTVEGGHVFAGDYSGLPGKEAPYLRRASYGYLNLHLGLEIGRRDVVRVFFRGGLTLASASLEEIQASLQQQQQDATLTSSDASVGISPFFSGKAGAAVFF